MKICSELTPITPTDSEHLFISALRNSTVYRTWAKLSCLSHKYCTPYLTSKSFYNLRGTWNSFNVSYTNAGKDYSFKAELHFGYLRNKTKDALDFILFFLYALAGGPLRGFILRACYLRVNTILHTSPIEITRVSMEPESFLQVRNSTRFLMFVSPCIVVQFK
jgi:hypothetical protein